MESIHLNWELEKVVAHCGEVGRYLWDRGWAEMNAGNISIDVTDKLPSGLETSGSSLFYEPAFQKMETPHPSLAGAAFFVTGTGKRLRDLEARPKESACFLKVSDDGEGYHLLWGGVGDPAFAPTSELLCHLTVHQELRNSRDPRKALIHTHPTELTALTHDPAFKSAEALNRVLWAMHPETRVILFDGLGYVPYQTPGSESLANLTKEAAKKHRVVLWEKHGSISLAEDVLGAFDLVDTLNKAARMLLLCRSAGFEPEGLDEKQLGDLETRFNLRGEDQDI